VALVVGYDRHRASRAALVFAAELAGALNVPVRIVHVSDMADRSLGTDPAPTAEAEQRQAAHERDYIATLLRGTEVQWSYHVMQGDPATALLQAATVRHANMIVVGRPEQGFSAALGHMISGAVARTLIRHSQRPVVVVPPPVDFP